LANSGVRKTLLGLSEAVGTVARSRSVGFGLAALAVALGVVALLKSPIAGAIIIGSLILVFAGVAFYGLILRDRFGGLWQIIDDIDEWDIPDDTGKLVLLTKTRKLRFLQNGVFAIRDYAWGSGKVDGNYSCAPGHAADHFWHDGRHNVVVSLRETKRRGDIEDFTIKREFADSFCEDSESVHAEIMTETQQLTIKVVFPGSRPPTKAWASSRSDEAANKKHSKLDIHGGVDGRQFVTHTLTRPKLGENYVVGWDW
jgi:hypothetical protein